MISKLTLYKGLILGEGTQALTIEKAGSENIYLRLHSTAQRRIIPTQLILDLLTHLQSGKITLQDISRKYRSDHGLPHLFEFLDIDYDKFLLGYEATISKLCDYELVGNLTDLVLLGKQSLTSLILPKPFILLSGISGTGKTRFVKQQAQRFRSDGSNYCLVPVRPDWHEPSDLLGYISRLGSNGSEYIVTEFLVFLVAAWKNISSDGVNINDDATPYWLCLDEMNLAPVEQYFADYLAVIESRQWDDGEYACAPLLHANIFEQVADSDTLRASLKLAGDENDVLWQHFLTHGISIPPNLIVAGTVNMDETTHGFSRKVIDRAFTIDFGEFFPNDYQGYFEASTQAKTLGFPRHSSVNEDALTDYDADGIKSIVFLTAVNGVLKTTPFELAYRALNELLLAVVCFKPETDAELQAVWDDFLMTKVLPRIEGDSEKLHDDGESSLFSQLNNVLGEQLSEIWGENQKRPDLLRESVDGEALEIGCRAKKKIGWMQSRLSSNGFTSFWP